MNFVPLISSEKSIYGNLEYQVSIIEVTRKGNAKVKYFTIPW